MYEIAVCFVISSIGSCMEITVFFCSDGSHLTEKLSKTEHETAAKVLALL
jgi:hypothetical protein